MQRDSIGVKRSTSLVALENLSTASTMISNVPVATDSCGYSTVSYVPTNPLPPSPVKVERPRKRLKLDCKPPATPEIANLRKLICDYKHRLLSDIRESYVEHRTEQFFLQNGWSIMDYYTWKKKPSIQLINFIRTNPIDSDDEDEKRKTEVSKVSSSKGETGAILAQLNKTTSSDIAVGHRSDYRQPSINATQLSALPGTCRSAPVSPSHSQARHAAGPCDGVTSSSEAIVERAKQEAQIMQRVAELRKQGLWSAKRLPKVQEPARNKAHWDYLLEEMQWLAADFAQEKKWKRAGCRKIARLVARHFQDKVDAEKKAEKEGGLKIKKIASLMAKCMRDFWCNIEKVVQYKQQSRLDEKRRKALDTHLNFIVDQTEKYSNWLTEGFGQEHRGTASISSSFSGTVLDDEFEPVSESDDEETIEKEELDLDKNLRQKEIEELEKESVIPLQDLINAFPQDVLEKPAPISSYGNDITRGNSPLSDQEFSADETSCDDEETLNEQEMHEGRNNCNDELNDLKHENELPLEKLLEIYSGAYDVNFEMPETPSGSEYEKELADVGTEDDDEDEMQASNVGIEYLLHPEKTDVDLPATKDSDSPSREITDIAATAESLQPTGYTLETTKVKTPIPFLLKHSLREYQHVGLDWLATMYEKKLNGILADEMGLGKTIQTIALFAHLACEHGIWGPHLIVVPTSVMLNWEMEFKKWCPSFKLLTYYGTPKERKLKRQGWTKTNAFHVCITSYKLVIQDHQSFRRKKWKYLVLDEAQNIKNFKSQRWQTLLNFSSQRRLLLTGTPLQNSLMELWSLMHFLMPNVFQSHNEFKEWFANPLTGMIEGNQEYNENLIRRLHKVLRPFLLRRLKQDVEKQMPKKYEHVIMCRLSKRQRFLYDDFMSQRQTKEILASGQFMSVINILMQLRKVCNHPNLFDPRPIVSPFETEGISLEVPSLVLQALQYDPLKDMALNIYFPNMSDLELELSAYAAHRIRKLQVPRKLIEEVYSLPEPQVRPLPTKLRPFVIRSSSVPAQSSHSGQVLPSATAVSSKVGVTKPAAFTPVTGGVTPKGSSSLPQPITVQIQQTQQGTRLMIPSGQLSHLPAGFLHIVQSSTGHHITTAAPIQTVAPLSSPALNSFAPAVGSVTMVSSSAAPAVVNGGQVTARPSVQLPLAVANVAAVPMKPVVRVLPMGSNVSAESLPAPYSGLPSKKLTRNEENPCGHMPELLISSVEMKRAARRKEVLHRLVTVNKNHCGWKPVYGQDLCEAVNVWKVSDKAEISTDDSERRCIPGVLHCRRALNTQLTSMAISQWKQTHALARALNTPDMWLNQLKDVIERFVFITPPVVSYKGISMRASHYPPSLLVQEARQEMKLRDGLAPLLSKLHSIHTRMSVQFPEKRLIQYDCGKLQTLDVLLRNLKRGDHRVLIFTQMTRMLDVLETFLNFHGYRYLRLDGTTKVENRQLLMDRFNHDAKIFCFILSTRSGGIGVNLTGADTVIFYDSDWNPTMDAQAQDRCHRIGQTRDVHIYRLVSEKTVEENILKKSNQKRMLGDVAIEGGNFTTAFFKEHTIKELFEEPSGLGALTSQYSERKEEAKEPPKRQFAIATSIKQPADGSGDTTMSQSQLEQALCNAEDEQDVQATIVARAEQSAELAEFDENIPWDEKEAELRRKEEESCGSKVEEEIALMEKELKPIERYAIHFLEETDDQFSLDAVKTAEDDIEVAKQEWELARLKALREEEERRAELEEDEVLFTYSRDDACQVFKDSLTGELMTMWCPPTPPATDCDIFIDHSHGFLYEPAVMTESALPAVYTKKERKRVKQEVSSGRKKMRLEEVPRVPRSLFDRPNATLLKMRRDMKAQKQGTPPSSISRPNNGAVFSSSASTVQAQSTVSSSSPYPGMKLPVPLVGVRPPAPDVPHDQPEWLIHEDWALLQAVQILLQLPLNLTVVSPAHIPNWDLVADTVNAISRIYRSSKQCKLRYENIIIPREEGRILYDINPRKQSKKSKGIYKTKNNRPMKTSQLYMQDHGSSVTTLHAFRFDCIKNVSAKRVPTLRPTLVHPMSRNPKHAAVLAENGISYDQPLLPVQVAAIRQERINREKKQSQNLTSAAPLGTAPIVGSSSLAAVATAQPAPDQQQVQLLGCRTIATAGQQAVTTSAVLQRTNGVMPIATPVSALTQQGTSAQQLQSVASLGIAASSSSGASVMAAAVTPKTAPGQTVSIARNLTSGGGSIVVNTAGGMAAALNKRVAQAPAIAAVVATSQPQAITTAAASSTTSIATLARGGRPLPLTVNEVSAAVRMAAASPAASNTNQSQMRQMPSTAAITPAVQQQLTAQNRLLSQQQLMQMKHQVIKQRSATQSPLGQAAQRMPNSAQVPQPGQQLAQIQQSSSSVSVATLVKTVSTSGLASTSMTIPVTAVSVGGVNINVSLPHQQKAAIASQALTKSSSISPPTTAQQSLQRQLQLQQMQKQKLPQTNQLTQKVALTPAQMQQVASKLPVCLTQGQVQVVQQKNTASIAQLQHILQQQHLQQKPTTVQGPTIQQIITSVPHANAPTIIAMQSIPQSTVGHIATSGVSTGNLSTVATPSSRQITPMQTTLTIVSSTSSASLVATPATQPSSITAASMSSSPPE